MAQNKMNWMIEKFNNNTMDYIIHNTNEKKGTIVAPTGFGKSGVMFSDTIYHIMNSNAKKMVFHYAFPILKLGVQSMDDLISVLSVIFKDKCDNGEFMFFINSSADGRDYNLNGLNADTNRFEYDIEKFEKSMTAKYAIVVSCFDSIYKFADKVDYLNNFATLVTYIDEAHLIVNETRDDKKYEELTEDKKVRWNSLEKLCMGEYLYALTATPDKEITANINRLANKNNLTEYIINIKPSSLIEANVILPVKMYTSRVNNDKEVEKITDEHCIMFMEMVKADLPNIKHKILVTASNTEHLRNLQNALSNKGYKVFSTCSRDGATYSENDEMVDIDEVKFIDEVDSYNDDCFVIHIKQLRQGIDIKTITDIIFYNSSRVCDGVKRTIVQTIGRSLRPAIDERGKIIEERTKKYSSALFLIGDDDFETVERQMFAFVIDYYGIKGVSAFTNDVTKNHGETGKTKGIINVFPSNTGFGNDYFDWRAIMIEELLMNIGEYIKNVIKPRYDMALRLTGGKPSRNLIPTALAEVKNKFSLCDGEHNTAILLSDTEFMDAIAKLFEKYEVI